MYYYIKINYNEGTKFRGFFNNFLFGEIPAYVTSFYKFFCESFFIKGDNSLTLTWGDMPWEPGYTPGGVQIEASPFFLVSLIRISSLGDEGEVIFEKKLTPKDILKENGVTLPAYKITFNNPTGLDFSSLLFGAIRCNESEKICKVKLPLLRKFSWDIYSRLLAGSISGIVRTSQVRLDDDAKARGENVRALSSEYAEVLQDISAEGLPYTLTQAEQIILLPTCEGRLWRMVIAESREQAEEVMKKVAMLPHAICKYGHELIESKENDGTALKLPSYIAEFGGQCQIVR